MNTDLQIAQEARKLIGTPWHHQARVPGVGCDCIGLGVLAGRAAGLKVLDYLCYSEDPSPGTLIEYLEANCDRMPDQPLDDVPVGYGILFWLVAKNRPQHFAIKTEIGMVHARRRRNLQGSVVEHRLTDFYRKHLHSIWRYQWQR